MTLAEDATTPQASGGLVPQLGLRSGLELLDDVRAEFPDRAHRIGDVLFKRLSAIQARRLVPPPKRISARHDFKRPHP